GPITAGPFQNGADKLYAAWIVRNPFVSKSSCHNNLQGMAKVRGRGRGVEISAATVKFSAAARGMGRQGRGRWRGGQASSTAGTSLASRPVSGVRRRRQWPAGEPEARKNDTTDFSEERQCT